MAMSDPDETPPDDRPPNPKEEKPGDAPPAAPAKSAKDLGPPREERRTRGLITLGSGLTVAGIALSVADGETGRWLVIAGIVIAFVALHRYGRLGPQEV
jgi:hypothetical protein